MNNYNIINIGTYLLIVDDSEIKEGDYIYNSVSKEIYKFKEINVKYGHKIMAHLPLNGTNIIENLPLLPPLEDEVEKLSEDSAEDVKENHADYRFREVYKEFYKEGYNKAKEKYKYTEEEMKRIYEKGYSAGRNELNSRESDKIKYDYIQSLQQPKIPVGFECEMWYNEFTGKRTIKTITNSQGITQLVGEYIY